MPSVSSLPYYLAGGLGGAAIGAGAQYGIKPKSSKEELIASALATGIVGGLGAHGVRQLRKTYLAEKSLNKIINKANDDVFRRASNLDDAFSEAMAAAKAPPDVRKPAYNAWMRAEKDIVDNLKRHSDDVSQVKIAWLKAPFRKKHMAVIMGAGTGVGAGTGAITGAYEASKSKKKNTARGAAVGALSGAAIGAFTAGAVMASHRGDSLLRAAKGAKEKVRERFADIIDAMRSGQRGREAAYNARRFGAPAGRATQPGWTPEWLRGVKTKAEAKKRFKAQAMQHHPDHGGSTERMAKLNDEWDVFSFSSEFQKLATAWFNELQKMATVSL